MPAAIVISQIKELRLLKINPMPSKPLRNARVLRVAQNIVVAIDDKGAIYSTQVAGPHRAQYSDLEHGRIRRTIDGLVKLGALSRKAVAEHNAINKREDERRTQRYAAQALLDNARDAGIKLTKAQAVKINKVLGGNVGSLATSLEKIADAG